MAGVAGGVLSALLPQAGALVGALAMAKEARRARQDFPDERSVQNKFLLLCSLMLAVCMTYGLIGAGLIGMDSVPSNASLAVGFVNGLSSSLAAVCVGYFGASAVQCGSQQPRLLVTFVLILVYLEAFALYGLIVSLVVVSRAHETGVDLSPGQVLPFVSAPVLANFGGLGGSVMAGVAILEVGVAKPELMIKCLPPVVFNGVTGIYGFITALVDMQAWPPSGGHGCVGPLYALSSVALAYVGCHGVRGIAEGHLTHETLAMRLIPYQGIGFAALVYGLFVAGSSSSSSSSSSRSSSPVEAVEVSLLERGPWHSAFWLSVSLLVVWALASIAGVAWAWRVQRQRLLAVPLLA